MSPLRAHSSVGLEHLVYTERVGGSTPSAPTTLRSLRRASRGKPHQNRIACTKKCAPQSPKGGVGLLKHLLLSNIVKRKPLFHVIKEPYLSLYIKKNLILLHKKLSTDDSLCIFYVRIFSCTTFIFSNLKTVSTTQAVPQILMLVSQNISIMPFRQRAAFVLKKLCFMLHLTQKKKHMYLRNT